MQALFSTITAIVAIAISLVTALFLWLELRMSRLALQTEALLTLDNRFYCREMLTCRRKAAANLLRAEPVNRELSDVLDFFSTVATLVGTKAIDRRLTFRLYGYWMVWYHVAAGAYIRETRKIDPPSWLEFEKLATQFKTEFDRKWTIDRSEAAVRTFLAEEARGEELPIGAVAE
jgi:hypothetical protein